MKELKGFVVSWFFAPYIGSADIDLFKRLKDTSFSCTVVQVRRDLRDDRVLEYATNAKFRRIELDADHRQPRTKRARKKFIEGTIQAFGASSERYDFLLSHSNEMVSHAAAAEIKRRHPQLPWIAYFGDLFVANPYVKYIEDYPLVEEDCEIERATLRQADLVILNNPWQRDLMFRGDLARHAHKAVVVPHCFDPAMYPPVPERSSDKFTLAHLGTLYHVKRTAEPVLRGVERLLDIYPAYKKRFELVFYGGSPSANDIDVYASMRHRSHVRFEEPVGYLESLALMKQADALLLIDGIFNEREDGLTFSPFFPGKLADYMGARRPILAVTMPKGPTADILARSGNLLADERVDRIAYVLKRYLDRRIEPDYKVYEEFAVSEIAPQMERAIRSVVVS